MKFLIDKLYLAYNTLTIPNYIFFSCYSLYMKSFITQKNYLKFSKIILKLFKLIILFIATIRDQRIMHIFFE